jgi:hypothetical protein
VKKRHKILIAQLEDVPVFQPDGRCCRAAGSALSMTSWAVAAEIKVQ